MKRCLIIDDSSVIRKVARNILESMKLEVAEAENGHDALEQMRAGTPFDLILLDWHMPVMTATEFLSTLRLTGAGRRPYIIYLTTENDPNDISRAMTAGADDFFLKPFDRASLVSKIAVLKTAA